MKPFVFKQCTNILKSTQRKAITIRELLHGIEEVSDASIFHHTYKYFLKGHVLEYTNDFAQWVGESLEEHTLAEHLSNVDPYDFTSIPALRGKIVEVVDDYLIRFPEPRPAMRGNEFYFNESATIIFPTGIVAHNLAEFLQALKYVDGSSVYYHFYEGRIHGVFGPDDFSLWLKDQAGEEGLSERLLHIDPFMYDIEGMRRLIVQTVEQKVQKDMETI
ncbi:MAG: DUF5752 family protein [Deltaproteobacteria bacterium]|nr:DUF5752 family protein [Deltaproteobacteria bacterium]